MSSVLLLALLSCRMSQPLNCGVTPWICIIPCSLVERLVLLKITPIILMGLLINKLHGMSYHYVSPQKLSTVINCVEQLNIRLPQPLYTVFSCRTLAFNQSTYVEHVLQYVYHLQHCQTVWNIFNIHLPTTNSTTPHTTFIDTPTGVNHTKLRCFTNIYVGSVPASNRKLTTAFLNWMLDNQPSPHTETHTNNWCYWFNLESEPKLLPNLHRQTVYLSLKSQSPTVL